MLADILHLISELCYQSLLSYDLARQLINIEMYTV